MTSNLLEKVTEKHDEYMMDESRMAGSAETISFPETEEEVVAIVKELQGKPITIQGGHTGLTGGAVPFGGHLMNLSKMKGAEKSKRMADGSGTITVGPGVTLEELSAILDSNFKDKPLFWPPRPTEPKATVGGVVALDAKGINACHYGDSRQYVEEVRFVDSHGVVRTLSRERNPEDFRLTIGAEGLIGPITRLTLKLLPKPESVWGLGFFFNHDEDADKFADNMRKFNKENDTAWISAMEYMDINTLNLITVRKPFTESVSSLPDIPENTCAMIYIEVEGEEAGIEELVMGIAELASSCGLDADETWALTGQTEAYKLRDYRHMAPETVNMRIDAARTIDPRIRKLGTDIEYPGRDFQTMVSEYREGLRKTGLYGCIFGGIDDSHMHVNIIPKNYDEYEKGRELIKGWTAAAALQGGNPSTEHGVGKLKQSVISEKQLDEIRDRLRGLKEKYDPEWMFNRGDVFSS